MLYVKTKISEDAEIKTEITDENVFCTCPGCGTEVHVDLAEMLQDEEFDLYSSALYCDECSERILKSHEA